MKCFRFVSVLFLLGICVCAALAIAISPAQAAGPSLIVSNPGDNPLVINDYLNMPTTLYSGLVRLQAVGGDIGKVQLLAGDLVDSSVTPPLIINRSSISIPSDLKFTSGEIQDVRVTITNVVHAGQYTGHIKLALPGQAEADALDITLQLNIYEHPNVQSVKATFTIKSVHNLFLPLDNVLSAWFVPDSYDYGNWKIMLNNQGSESVTLTNPTVELTGGTTGTTITADQITVSPSTVKLVPHQITPLQLTIKHDNLPPDHYQGTIQFQVVGPSTSTIISSEAPISVNMDLSVRYGPTLPVIVLIIGILLGRLAVNMTTPLARKQTDLMPRYYQLKNEIDAVPDLYPFNQLTSPPNCTFQSVKEKLTADLQEIYKEIQSTDPKDTEDEVTQKINALESRISLVTNLVDQIKKIKTLKQEKQRELLQKVDDVLCLLIAGNDTDAQNEYSAIDKEVQNEIQSEYVPSPPSTPKQPLDVSRHGLPRVNENSKRRRSDYLENPEETKGQEPTRQSIGAFLLRFLVWLSPLWLWLSRAFAWLLSFLTGYHRPDAELRYWAARPLLGLLLLVLLVLIGLQNIYVTNGSTFGATGVYDFLGLFLWSFSADIASRSLQNLPNTGRPTTP